MVETHAAPVLVYVSPGCPDCASLKAWLAQQGVAFEQRDLSDPTIAAEAKARTGVRVAPITMLGEQIFYGTFASQKPRLERALGLPVTDEDRSQAPSDGRTLS